MLLVVNGTPCSDHGSGFWYSLCFHLWHCVTRQIPRNRMGIKLSTVRLLSSVFNILILVFNILCYLRSLMGFPVAQMVKNLPATQETQVAWVGKIPWRRERQLTPIFLPREFHGQRSLVVYSPWGWKELDTTERLTLSFHFQASYWCVCTTWGQGLISFLIMYYVHGSECREAHIMMMKNISMFII